MGAGGAVRVHEQRQAVNHHRLVAVRRSGEDRSCSNRSLIVSRMPCVPSGAAARSAARGGGTDQQFKSGHLHVAAPCCRGGAVLPRKSCNMTRLSMRRVVAGLIVSLLLLARPSSAFAGWTRFASEHFLFIGDVSENDLRKRREPPRAVSRHHRPRLSVGPDDRRVAPRPAPLPTIVLVFKNDRSFAPFRPEFEGRPVEVAGYATSSEDTNYIAVNAAPRRRCLRHHFPRVRHLYLREAVGEVPLWLNEGLAEFYETFESERSGRVP